MNDILKKIYAAKAIVLAHDEAREPLASLRERAERRRSERRSFKAALASARGPALIAEIKRASPSAGMIAEHMDPATVAAAYAAAGADAISVLTESEHFLGELAYLDIARAHAPMPILRKDFLSTPYQIVQAAAHGADAVLAIVAGLDDAQLKALLAEAERYDLDVLVEVHDHPELDRAIALGAGILGINNRNLRTFVTDLAVSETLLAVLAPGTLVISESGIRDLADCTRLAAAGARGFLIGETLMRGGPELIHRIKALPVPA